MTKSTLKIKKGDTVLVRAGSEKSKTGKVVAVDIERRKVQVESLHPMIKHVKPTRQAPQGGIEKKTRFIDISNVSIVHPTDKKKSSRVGYKMDEKNTKKRVYRQAGNKEIK